LPFVQQEVGINAHVALEKILTFGQGESVLASKLEPLTIPDGITLGSRSSMPHLEIKLVARGDAALAQLPAITEQVKSGR
ncbi:damage-inducible protein CinA, partial [Shewanella sp. A3A]|nr:damage-inducible protein CinA [Shewanella ferrihydritica]